MDNTSPPLCTAAFIGDYKECERLIGEGADVSEADAEGESPLKLAVWEGHLDVIHLLCFHGADVNQEDRNGDTPLYKAVAQGNLGVVQLFCEKGADVNRIDKEGRFVFSIFICDTFIALHLTISDIMNSNFQANSDVCCSDGECGCDQAPPGLGGHH